MSYGDIKAMNWSTLKLMANPAEYRWALEHREHRDSPAMLLGRAIHCMVLEPDDFEARYAMLPAGINLRTKAGKEERDALLATGLEILTATQMATVVACAGAVAANDEAAELLDGCEVERSLVWEIDGLKCKGRLDAVAPDRVVDLKTCRSLESFARVMGDGSVVAWDAARRLYHGQLAWYTMGAIQSGIMVSGSGLPSASYIIAVETQPPWDCAVFRLPSHFLEAGRQLYETYLRRFRSCTELDEWPGRFPGVTTLELPRWAMGEDEGY